MVSNSLFSFADLSLTVVVSLAINAHALPGLLVDLDDRSGHQRVLRHEFSAQRDGVLLDRARPIQLLGDKVAHTV